MLTTQERNRRYLDTHREESRVRSFEYRQKHPEYCREYHRRARLEALEHYGGSPPKCNCCGETEFMFLTLDHVDGNGREMRRKNSIKSSGIYEFLRKRGYPEGYRVLCYNCNCSIGNFGYCPRNGGSDGKKC